LAGAWIGPETVAGGTLTEQADVPVRAEALRGEAS
jgi:hypothetical protein